jgi:hypothetical protein
MNCGELALVPELRDERVLERPAEASWQGSSSQEAWD